MKRTKNWIVLVALIAPLFSYAAERVTCEDAQKRWSVQFTLDGAKATGLLFKNGEKEIAFYPELEAQTSRFLKYRLFEFKLGGIQYFDLYRVRDSKTFEAAFFFGSNPFRSDTQVSCLAEEVFSP